MLDLKRFLYVEWVITYGCNFRCAYCFFGRGNLRKGAYMFRHRGPHSPGNAVERVLLPLGRKLGVLHYADSFLNHPPAAWLRLFAGLAEFKRDLYLSLTGGEPLLLAKELAEFLPQLERLFDRVHIRVDTNGSIVPASLGIDRERLGFNVSYHPAQIEREVLLRNLGGLNRCGRVLMVNRVFLREEFGMVEQEVAFFRERGYFLNVSPCDFDVSGCTETELAGVRAARSELDFEYPLLSRTVGRPCPYPMFGLQLLPSGWARVPPCDPLSLNLLADPARARELLKPAPIACPAKCVCFHQYPWTAGGYEDMDIMAAYVRRNEVWRLERLSAPTV